jgi:serine/threonine protein kinase
MELTVQNVYGLLLRSKLLSLDEARGMFARWEGVAGEGAGNLARFAAWMVANRYVTEYQASLLARGHAEGFFLEDYKILDRLGKGRMAGVYKAQHKLGQIVAIKVLPPSKAKDGNYLARFQRESRLALKLRHPNIVRGFEMGEVDGLHYLVMEQLEGETLEEVLSRRGRLTPAEGVRLIYQALQGLQHIHTQGFVHRDLKPSNLMLVPAPTPESTLRCTVKILDIGLGRVFGEDSADDPDAGLTAEGVLLGTPDYMAPEQARDPRSIDIRADIYALGCVLYHLLAGQPPFPDTNIISQMIKHATEPPRSLREFNPAVPDGLEKIIGFLMTKDPAGRYATPERAAQALVTFLAAESGPLSSPDLDPAMKPYLTWLEIGDRKRTDPLPTAPPGVTAHYSNPPLATPVAPQPAGTPPVPRAVPVSAAAAAPAAPAAAGKPATAPLPGAATVPLPHLIAPPSPARVDRKARKNRRAARQADTAAAASPAAPGQADVELVPTPTLPARKRAGMQLSRRDFFAFGLGVLSTLLAIGVGALASWIVSGPRRR